jgi:hypothetical protein
MGKNKRKGARAPVDSVIGYGAGEGAGETAAHARETAAGAHAHADRLGAAEVTADHRKRWVAHFRAVRGYSEAEARRAYSEAFPNA